MNRAWTPGNWWQTLARGAGFSLLVSWGALAAQSPDWSSTLVIAPTPSPYLADWERVPSTALLSIAYTGAGATDFRVRATLTSLERGQVGVTESPVVSLPGGPSAFLYNVRDAVFEWTTISRNRLITDAALKTGQIPEGSYRACARVFVGNATTPATEACAEFSIYQPDPPQLVAPQDQDVVVSTQPFFQWTPVLAPPSVRVSYEITVVELLGKQTPRAAVESNIPVLQAVARAPFLIYPIDALQLERTKSYAWRVRAVDDEGRQLFRDGAQSEIWSFGMSDELLRPVGKIADLPDTLVLIPGVALLRGIRSANLKRGETDVEIDGTLELEFPGAAGSKPQSVKASRLRAGFLPDGLSLLSGRIEATVPPEFVPEHVRPFVTFAPLVFTTESGFRATASLKIPGQPAVPLTGAVQLSSGGLFGRLEGSRATGFPIARLGRAPVQYAAQTARLTFPDGRLEFGGKVLLFEQDVGCPAAGEMVESIVRLPVFCDPTSGFRPDTSSARSLMTFGTVGGTLAADLLTDTLGTDLRTSATFSVLGDANRTCAIDFTLVFARDTLRREDERSNCGKDEGAADFGWLKLQFRDLRLERLDYVPGAMLIFRALVDIEPNVRGADNLQLPMIRGVRLDERGVQLPASRSDSAGSNTSGYAELGGIGVLPRTMGFKGGFLTYDRWLAGRDPGFEWGTADSWIRFANVPNAVSSCIDAMPFEVDTLTIRDGVLDAALIEKRWDDGCRLFPADNIHLEVKSAGGRVTFALDSVARITSLPLITGGIIHPKGDCGVPVIGCIDLFNYDQLDGTMRLTPYGRILGTWSDYKPSWATYDLRFAKLKLAGGGVSLGVDTAGAQTALYDGRVTVSFDKVDTTARDTTKKSDSTSVLSTVLNLASGFFASGDTTTAPAKIDLIAPKLAGGQIPLKGPFKLSIGFVNLIIGEAMLDTAGLHVDGRHRVVVAKTTATAKSTASGDSASGGGSTGSTAPAKVDSTYSTKDDTLGVTFARVTLDPATADLSAGTITFDGRLALESSPLLGAIGLGVATGVGLVTGGTETAGQVATAGVQGTGIYGFKLVDASGAFDPKGTFGSIRLNLPNSPTLDATGMRIDGVAPANAAFAGSRYDSASVSFENGFAMKPGAAQVTAGRALVSLKQYPIAYLEPAGWRIALAELVQTLIPDTLFLADKWTAFVVLRNAEKQLLVSVNETLEGPRITTIPGTPLRIEIPALKGSRESAPTALISMDLTLEKGTWRPLAGEVKAMAGGSAADDFNDIEFPFALDSVIFRASRTAPASFFAHGRLDVWPGEHNPMRIALGFNGGGELSASMEQSFVDSLPLVNGSALVKFHIDTLRFSASGKLGPQFQWRLETPGRLAYYDADAAKESVLARATFRLSNSEAAFVNFESMDSLATLRLPGVDLRLGRVRAPTFRWDFAGKRFDFELLFDVGLLIPALDSLKLPEIRDIRLTPQGLTIPAFEMAAAPVTPEPGDPFVPEAQALAIGGFSVRALAYRVSEFRWNWFANAPPPSFNFGVDLEFGIEDLPSEVEGQAARIALRALNVGMTNGRFTGSFERIDIPTPIRTAVADIRGAFGSFVIAEGQVPDIRIGVLADLRLPDVLACPDLASRRVSLDSPRDTLFIASNGTLRGTIQGILPQCPMALGPFDLAFGASTAQFGYDPTTQRATAVLDASATLTVPGASEGERVSATGRVVLDIANGRIADASLAIDQPFFWAPDPANPFLRLVVSQASLTQQELRFGATGQLRTNEGAGVDVAFEDVAFDLNTLKLRSGRIRLTADAAVGIEIPDDGTLMFGVYPVTTPRGGTASARLVLPSGALIDSAGLHISGTATASLGFGGETYASLAGEFANDFTISFATRVAIARGRVNLRDTAGAMIAYADSSGFWPGNVFAVLPIPARLGLPSEDIAYIQLRDAAGVLAIETEFGPETVRLRTAPNQRIAVVLPGLAATGGGAVPTVMAEFDLVYNVRTMLPVSGALMLQSPPGEVLLALEGMPIAITQLGFQADAGGFRLKAGARATLPGPLAGVDLEFRDLVVSAAGLTGTIELGSYSETFDASATPIATANLLGDSLAIDFTGAELTIDAANTRVRISGGIRSALLKKADGAPRVINLAATVDATGFRATADISDSETPIPIGVASLTLEGSAGQPALVVTASATEFAITLGGSLRLPTIAPGFSLAVDGMKIGSAGISIPNVSITAPANTKEFTLFGAKFALRDSTVGQTQVAPAIGIQLEQGIMRFTLSGYVTVLENTTRFIGFRFGTDGQFAIQGASFISKPIDVIPGVARLVSARIATGNLEFVGDVKLPAPFTQGAPQQLIVRISPEGVVSGGGKLVVIAEAEGLATAQTKLSLGIAAFHLRRLTVEIDVAEAANTAVSMVADIYVQEKQANLLRFGSVNGNVVTPGLRIAVNGDVTFGGFTMPNPISIDFDPVKLTFKEITSSTTPTGWKVALSGALALKLEGAGGSLNFRNIGFDSEGEVHLGDGTFDGGTFTIAEKIKITVGRIAWSDSDTSIFVPLKARPNAQGEFAPDSTLAPVSSFLDFGASVDIADTFSGGVDRVLVYVRSDDSTTHFLVENLAVNLPGVLEFNAWLNYDELPDGFDFNLSAQGRLLSAYRFGMVGVMGQRGNIFRAGLFLRTSVTVPLVPGIVTLTEVGGGIFINPDPADLILVKNIAGLSGPAANKIGMPPAKSFAVMLYAGIEVAGSNGVSAAQGRAMVTITDKAFQLNATATFFQMKDQIKGDLAVQVGWDPEVYVRGAVALEISIPKTVQGIAEVEFFAGGNVFAVKGDVRLTIVEVLQAYAQVIVVPSGFTANLGFLVEKQTDIVGLRLAGNLRIWYRPSTDDLGAYLKLVGGVTALGVTGELGLVGALVIRPELAIYGQGFARIVGVEALTLEVWVQYTSAGLKAGLGNNAELAAVIANAEQIARDLEDEANRILAGIDANALARALQPIVISDASLNAAYENFQRWRGWDLILSWGLFRASEGTYRGGLMPFAATDAYSELYKRALTSDEAAADTAIVRQLREEATQKLAVINDRRAEVEERIRALRLELDEAEQAARFIPPPDPVQEWSFGNPSFVTGPPGPDGRTIMQVVGAPVFELDDVAAASAQSAMTEAQAATAARPERLRAQLGAVEAGLATVRAATTASDPNSFASYSRLHSEAVEAIEHQHAANVDFRMRRRTWTQAKLDSLDMERAGLEQRLDAKILGVATFQQTAQDADWKRRRATAQDLDALATKRAEFLTAWTKDQTFLAEYQTAAAPQRDAIQANASKLLANPTDGGALGEMDNAIVFFRDKAKSFGLYAWWSVAHTGLTTARDGASAQVDAANAVAVPVIRAMRDMHARITTDLDSLNRRQAELYGVLYDLYDAYLRTYGAQDSSFNAFTTRKAALAALLQTPTLTSPRVTVTDFGYLSAINSTWSGSHANGVYEFLMQDGDDSLFTVGAQGQARRWAYTTNQAGGSTPRNQRLYVRGGAGFTASALTPYTVTFRQGSAANPVTHIAVPPPDLTPPGRPLVELPDLLTRAGLNGEPELWTGDSSRIVARWSATDAESGIAEYQYRVLSWPLPTAPTGGTQTFGQQGITVLQPTSLTDWVSAGGRTSLTIVGLNLPPNRIISVEVRAKNGTGLTGDVGGSPMLRYDPTPPQFPVGTTLTTVLVGRTTAPNLPGSFVFGSPPLLPVCGMGIALRGGAATKVWDGRLVMVAANDAVVGGTSGARVVLSRPTALDAETGIGSYWYHVDSMVPTGSLPADGWREILETGATFTATGPAFTYGRPRWVTLVAFNQAGRRSAPITVGPFTVADPSAPSTPVFCADYAQGGFIAYLTTPSTDEESGVRGYQVRVRGNGGAILRDFPANGAIDWPATQALANTGVRLTVTPGGGQHTVELRAVNGVGAAGPYAQSGQILVDVTPPPVAGATGSLSMFGATINLTLANDPESGLAGVDIAFGSSPTDPTLVKGGAPLMLPYTTYPAAAGPSKKDIAFPAGTVLTPTIYAYIRVRNGAGLLSTAVSVRIR